MNKLLINREIYNVVKDLNKRTQVLEKNGETFHLVTHREGAFGRKMVCYLKDKDFNPLISFIDGNKILVL